MKRAKRGFTIIELLMVVAIISILLSFTVTATTGAIRRAREERARACVLTVNQGIAAYYAKEGKWPGPIGSQLDSGSIIKTENGGNAEYYELSADEVRRTVKVLVDEAREGHPVMDISGLFVSRRSGEGGKDFGLDFMSAIRGTKKSGQKMTSSEMYFGYPESEHGYFRRLRAYYYPRTDRLVFLEPNANSEIAK